MDYIDTLLPDLDEDADEEDSVTKTAEADSVSGSVEEEDWDKNCDDAEAIKANGNEAEGEPKLDENNKQPLPDSVPFQTYKKLKTSKASNGDTQKNSTSHSSKENGTACLAYNFGCNPNGSLLELSYKLKAAQRKIFGDKVAENVLRKPHSMNTFQSGMCDQQNFDLESRHSNTVQTSLWPVLAATNSNTSGLSVVHSRFFESLEQQNSKIHGDMSCDSTDSHSLPGGVVPDQMTKPLSEKELQAIVDSAVNCALQSNVTGKKGKSTAASKRAANLEQNSRYFPGSGENLGRKHKCNYCDYQTDNRSHMRRHESTVHSLCKPYICFICEKEFSRSEKVKSHFLKSHPEHVYDAKLVRKQKPLMPSTTSNSFTDDVPLDMSVDEGDLTTHSVDNNNSRMSPDSDSPRQTPEKEGVWMSSGSLLKTSPTCIREGEKKFECLQCGYSGRDIWHLKRHIADVHSKQKDFRCPLCSYATSRKHRLISHMKGHGELFCFHCDYSTIDVEHFHTHTRVCALLHRVPPVVCRHCTANLGTRKMLQDHCLRQHNVVVYWCELCSYCGENREEYEAHLDLHKEGPNQSSNIQFCNLCNKVFANTEDYDTHMQEMHLPDEDGQSATADSISIFTCTFCGFATADRTGMQNHLLTHREEQKPCGFPGCEFKATWEKSLEIHRRNIHGMPKSSTELPLSPSTSSMSKSPRATQANPGDMVCPVCGIQFKYRKSFQKHVANHKDEEEKCPLCDDVFYLRINLKKHLQEVHNADVVEVSSSSDDEGNESNNNPTSGSKPDKTSL